MRVVERLLMLKEVIWLSFLFIPPIVLRADVDTHAP
jgi:hypothetical protein